MTEDTPDSAVVLAVASAMRVSIIGAASLPAWAFSGSGSAFTVAEYGHLSLGYIDLALSSAPKSGAAAIVARLGGEVSIDQSQLKQVSFDIGGTLALTATRATDIQLQTDPRSAITMNAVTLIGLAGLILLHAAAVVCFGTRW